MFKRTILFCVVILSAKAGAIPVTHNGYTLETSTKIITSGHLEWLQWKSTAGLSIDDALAQYSAAGWRLANEKEMAGLMNDFFGFAYTFDTKENTEEYVRFPFVEGDTGDEPTNQFLALFGYTVTNYSGSGEEKQRRVIAYYGDDADGDGWYNRAEVFDDFRDDRGYEVYGQAFMSGDTKSGALSYHSGSGTGVALVRSVVPVPAAAWLFGSALLGLVGLNRRK